MPSPHKGFHLARYFMLSSAGAFALVALALVYQEALHGERFERALTEQAQAFDDAQRRFVTAQRTSARAALLAVHERGNVNLTRLFGNALWEDTLAPLLARVAQIDIGRCRGIVRDEVARARPTPCPSTLGSEISALPEYAAFDTRVRASTADSAIFRIKVFDVRGITVYSTDPSQVGEDRAAYAPFRDALEGRVTNELGVPGRFGNAHPAVGHRGQISSYLPVREPGHERVAAVLELYSDVTPILEEIQRTSAQLEATAADARARVADVGIRARRDVDAGVQRSLALVLALLAVLFGSLYFIVRRAERLIVLDEAARERAHQRLAQAESMATLGQMAAGVVHQLNTPLAFTRNNVELVHAQLDEIEVPLREAARTADACDEPLAREALVACADRADGLQTMRDMLRDALHGVEQMSELVAHMRNFTRLDRARIGEFDLNGGLQTVVYIARSVVPTRIDIVEDYGVLPAIICVPSQLNQVFLNLITNAAQAIPAAGTVTVSTRVDGERVRVEVRDTGTGIAPDVLPHVFESYFSTKPEGEGTGLGLAIAQDIVRNHGGEIRVRSSPGQETCFTVWLPRDPGALLTQSVA